MVHTALEQGNEPSGSIKGGELFGHLSELLACQERFCSMQLTWRGEKSKARLLSAYLTQFITAYGKRLFSSFTVFECSAMYHCAAVQFRSISGRVIATPPAVLRHMSTVRIQEGITSLKKRGRWRDKMTNCNLHILIFQEVTSLYVLTSDDCTWKECRPLYLTTEGNNSVITNNKHHTGIIHIRQLLSVTVCAAFFGP